MGLELPTQRQLGQAQLVCVKAQSLGSATATGRRVMICRSVESLFYGITILYTWKIYRNIIIILESLYIYITSLWKNDDHDDHDLHDDDDDDDDDDKIR